MEVREATVDDIPEIVSLLKTSLGETLMPKSEGYWRWKHIDNPYGQSPVLLSFDNAKLVGVRAFMRWKWQSGFEILESVRAVDTATHPDYQGKGIFKKLTLALLEKCSNENLKLVFNTPNEKSKPGYLKMGWLEAGKLPLNINIVSPFKMIGHVLSNGKRNSEIAEDESVKTYLSYPGVETLLKNTSFEKHYHSEPTVQTLRWRYLDVPNVKYHALAIIEKDSMRAMLFYRFKSSKVGLEMRITDFFYTSVEYIKKMSDEVMNKAKQHQAHFITSSGNDFSMGGSFLSVKKLGMGPIVTVRSINNFSLEQFQDFKNWRPSLGDLELF